MAVNNLLKHKFPLIPLRQLLATITVFFLFGTSVYAGSNLLSFSLKDILQKEADSIDKRLTSEDTLYDIASSVNTNTNTNNSNTNNSSNQSSNYGNSSGDGSDSNGSGYGSGSGSGSGNDTGGVCGLGCISSSDVLSFFGVSSLSSLSSFSSLSSIADMVESISEVASAFSGLSSGEGNFIVGTGLAWNIESGETARESLNLGSGNTPTFGGLKIDTDQVFKKEEGDVLKLLSIDALDSKTEDTIESTIDIQGDVTGTGLTSVTVGKIHGISFGTPTPTSGNLLIADGDSWESVGMSGDASITSSGVISISNNTIDFSHLSDSLVLDATTTIDMDTNSADLNFDSGTLFIDSSTGRVGVGTTGPDALLEVYKSQNTETKFQITNPNLGTSAFSSIALHNDSGWGALNLFGTQFTTSGSAIQNGLRLWTGAPGGIAIAAANASGEIKFFPGNSSIAKVVIDTSGNIGIGTTNPGYALNLSGEFNLTDAIRISGDAGTSGYLLTSSAGGANTWTDPSTIGTSVFLGLTDTPSSYTAGSILFTSGSAVTEDNANLYWDDSNNRLGIGTTSPSALLHLGIGSTAVVGQKIVLASGATANALEINTSSGVGGDLMVVDSSGNVGVGNTAPSNKLTLAGGNFYHFASGNPTVETYLDTTNGSTGVYISGHYAYVADQAGGLWIVDITDPSSPVTEGRYDTAGSAKKVHVAGRYAYLADGTSLQVIDISNPDSPTLAGSCSDVVNASDVYVSGRYAYIAASSYGLRVVDIKDPTNPTLVGTYDTAGTSNGVFVSGKYAYVADGGSGLAIIDISNPTSPTQVGSIATDTAKNVYVSGKYAYVADISSGMRVIDISDPTTPSISASLATGWLNDIFVSGDYAYLSDHSDGLKVADISDPTNPTLVGSCTTTGDPYGVYVSGKYAYIADWGKGLSIININGTETPALHAGNIETGALTVTENVEISNDLFVRSGINVGFGGISSDGPATISLGAGITAPHTALTVTQLGTGDILNLFDGTTEVMTVLDGGNLGIGTTAPDQALDVIGTIQASNLLGGAINLTTDVNGNIIRDPSDIRLKEDIDDIDTPLEKVLGLRGVSFNWTEESHMGDQREIGLIAQEVEQVVPEAVSQGGEYKSVKYTNLVGLLIEAIKELYAKVETLAGVGTPEGDIQLTPKEMPNCIEETLGKVYFDRELDNFYGCTSQGWKQLSREASPSAQQN